MNAKPLIVTGHGRSGTHWLASVLGHFVDARHEPNEIRGDVVVSCRLQHRMPALADTYRVIHLVRDGRDVVRSAHEFYKGSVDFETVCRGWAAVVDACKDQPTVRLEDLVRPVAASSGHRLPHWCEWPPELTHMFWSLCGEQMARHGYTP